MTGPRPQRTCQGCGYKFTPAGPDDRFCSGLCAGQPSIYSLLFAAQMAASRPAGR